MYFEQKLLLSSSKAKKFDVSGNPTDPSFFTPTLIFSAIFFCRDLDP